MTVLWALIFIVAVLGFWLLTLLGLPGNWMIVAATAFYAWLIPGTNGGTMRWLIVAIVTGLALLGEVVEFVASAASVKKKGGSRSGAILALVGSMVGAITGMFVGIPVPVIGSVIAALLFAGVGALAGAMLGETMVGKPLEHSWKVGQAAFWGRLFGTVAKALIGAVIVAVAIAVVFV
jgi:uncharacterized protein